ncbi:LPXTG cell wall anchor domain-containing protein [Kitasatospora sp. NBC_00240]|uniref:LAETG motif-containing sortase-dependent surface protein n=1 Tax=Kitasatospora sp. NBC_00240 TaxID=2903567 RepID=UPI002258D1D2|nr:LAETG motif-containing sortase-dependent surface protein [Kitasatospora sp. NBC_00240]MCX5211798.1 LPXTG cell wall anchor domain-containing protein [Kitasatospora sp. NBC_00240]
MRASGIYAFTKNVPSLSRRGKAAALAATVLLTGGVQLIGAESSWACNDDRFSGPREVYTDPTGQTKVGPDGEFRPFESATVAADGSWAEYGVSMANTSTTDYKKAYPNFGLKVSKGAAVRSKDVTVEVMRGGKWQRLANMPGCGPTIDADTAALAQPIAHGQTANFLFRVALSPASPQNQTELTLVTDAFAFDSQASGHSDLRTVKVTHPKAAPSTAPAKPGTAAKPAAPVTAKPGADSTAAAATPTGPAAGAATDTPAATAPATELAQTGASSPNGFLAGSAAAFLALGAGVMVVVRRRRTRA